MGNIPATPPDELGEWHIETVDMFDKKVCVALPAIEQSNVSAIVTNAFYAIKRFHPAIGFRRALFTELDSPQTDTPNDHMPVSTIPESTSAELRPSDPTSHGSLGY